MNDNDQEKVNILNLYGALTEPKNEPNNYGSYNPAYSGTSYTKNEIASMIGSNGDIADYKLKRKARSGFMQGCLKSNKATEHLCDCIWNSIIANYSYLKFYANSLKPTEEHNIFLMESAKNCFNKNQ